jgi:methyl-accepting chemotaxis protein
METAKRPNKISSNLTTEKQIIKARKNQPNLLTKNNNLKKQFAFLSTIRTKATILAVLIGTIPLVIVGAGSIYLTQESFEQQLIESEQLLADDLQDKVNLFMKERFGDIQVLANLDIFTNPAIRDILTPTEKAQILTEYQERYGVYDSIGLFDINGNAIAQTGDQPLGNHLGRSYIQDTLKTQKPVLSQPIISSSSGVFSVYAASVIKDKNSGEIIGFIRTRIPVAEIEKIIKRYDTDGKKYYLINSQEEVFIGPEGTYVTQTFSGSTQVTNTQSTYQAIKINSIFPDLKDLQRRGNTLGGEIYNIKTNTNQIVAYSLPQKLEGSTDLDWSAIIATDVDIAFASQKELAIILITGTILTIIIVTIVAIYLVNKFTQPILKTTSTVADIGQGKLSARVNVTGKDEIGLLANNINFMADRLESFVNSQQLTVKQSQLLAEISGLQPEDQTNLEIIFDQSLGKARLLLNTDRIVIYRFNSDWSGYISSESVARGWTPAKNQKIEDPCIPQHLLAQYKKDRVVPTEDVFNAGFHPEHLNLMKRLQIKANLVVPIVQQEDLYGLLIAHHCQNTHVWDNTEIEFMRDLAKELSGVLARLFYVEQLQKAQTEAENLAQQQSKIKDQLQKRALELLMEVDPVSRGDLTIRASVTPDEIGTIADSYNATIESLRKIVGQVQTAAQVVTSTTNDNEDFIKELAEQIQQQILEMKDTLTRIETVGNSITTVAENAQEAEQAVQEAVQTVALGDQAMNRTVEGILALRGTVAETAKKVKRLGEASQKISKVVNLIDGFTDQTNLLALNASIEAANAGEEGRGFAVVAEEVRNLAKQSADATAEITMLVEEIQTETNEVVAAMETGTEQVVTGTRLVEEARNSLTQIQRVSDRINELVKAIAQATVEQSQDSAIATQTINQIALVTEKTSTSVANVSDSFQQLLALAKDLETSVGQFKVN